MVLLAICVYEDDDSKAGRDSPTAAVKIVLGWLLRVICAKGSEHEHP